MTRIDRYLLFLYFRVLLIAFLSISGLLIVVQAFTNLEEFIQYGRSRGSLILVLVEYFGPNMLSYFERLSGLLAVMALLFTITWLYRTNELTAILAAGITKRRAMKPLLIASACVIGFAAFSRELLIPRFQDTLDRNPQDLTGVVARDVRPTFDRRLNLLLNGRHILPAKQEMVQPNFRVHSGPIAVAVGRQLTAEVLRAVPATDEHPAGFLLSGVVLPHGIDELESVLDSQGSPLLLTRREHSWLEPGQCLLVTEMQLDMLRGGSAWKNYASTMELIAQLKGGNTPSADDLRVQIHGRFVRPLIDWTVLLIGLPIVLARQDRNMFSAAGVCLLMVSGFTAFVMGINAAASSGYLFSPAVAAWIPLLVFVPLSYPKASAALES
jgi:lipopolysaccharide export system permease protein